MMDGFTPDEFDVSSYPDQPGFKGSGPTAETSIAAARTVASKAPTLRARCLAEIVAAGPLGLTGDEVAVRPRLRELLRLGKVEASGERRKTPSGASAVVWVAVGEAR